MPDLGEEKQKARAPGIQVPSQPRYEFEPKPHGEGGFARVIRGKDLELERDVAVKVLNRLATQFSPSEQERFRREARTLARLSHPNIPSIYDVDFGPGKFLIYFQFIEGTTLRKILDDEGVADFPRVQSWLKQVASALDHAHSLGVVHRDVKPDNIIITADRETAYLVDFGIALSVQEAKRLTESGNWIGTPGYMSPEQQAGEEVDAKADLYSLGVTLYESLAGRSIPQGQYQEISVLNQAVPPHIDELVRACLEPKERRLESAKAFIAKLGMSLVPQRPLSEVLSHGRLHEIASSLRELTSQSLMQLPAGQRALILVKVDDIVASEEPNLQYAIDQFLELLLTRGLLLEEDRYRDIVKPAIARGYEKTIDGRQGSRTLRDALVNASMLAQANPHRVLREEFVSYLKRTDLHQNPDWLLHDTREMLQALLANQACTEDAAELAQSLRQVNRIQTERS
jgi:serine/threonine-protein kinase